MLENLPGIAVRTHLHMTGDTIRPIDWIWIRYWPGT